MTNAASEADAFVRDHSHVIAFQTTCDAPYHNPSAFLGRLHGDYARKIISAFAHPKNHDNKKFSLSVELNLRVLEAATDPTVSAEADEARLLWTKYARLQPSLSKGFGGGTSVMSAIDSVLSLKSSILAAAVASDSFRHLDELYSRFLVLVRVTGGFPGHYAAMRDRKKFLESLLDEGRVLKLGHPNCAPQGKSAAAAPDKNLKSDAVGEPDAEVDNNDDGLDDSVATRMGRDGDKDDDNNEAENSIPSNPLAWINSLRVVNRWQTRNFPLLPSPTIAAPLCPSLAPVMALHSLPAASVSERLQRFHQLVHRQHPDSTGLVDVHLKVVYHSVAWTSCCQEDPAEGAERAAEDAICLADPEVAAARHAARSWHAFRERERLASLLLPLAQQQVCQSPWANDYRVLHNTFLRHGILDLQAAIYNLDVESGAMRQKEGQCNEENVWQATVPKLLKDLIVPRFAVETGLDQHAMLAWITKCFSMEMSPEEMEWAAAHPTGSGDLHAISVEEEEYRATSSSSSSPHEDHIAAFFAKRRQYALFKCLATYRQRMPFFHLVTSGTNLLKLESSRFAPYWKHVLIGEFDGLLLDLNASCEVLMCFEIKANPADIAKAHDQRGKLGSALGSCFAQVPVVNAHDPQCKSKPFAITVTEPKEFAPDPRLARQQEHRQPRQLPLHPFYDDVFPLSHHNFANRFQTPHGLMRNWVIVTNLALERQGGDGVWWPAYYAPCSGKLRHVLISCCAKLVAAAIWLSGGAKHSRPDFSAADGSSLSDLIASISIDPGCAKSVFVQIFNMFGRKSSLGDPNKVFRELALENASGNVVWVPKWVVQSIS